MATKKKAQDIPDGILALNHPGLPDLHFDESSLETRDFGAEGKAKPQVDQGPQMAELMAKMKLLEESNSQLQRTNMALMGQPQQQAAPQLVEFDTKGLPDPVQDPAAYAAETFRRAEAVIASRNAVQTHQQNTEQELRQRVSNIWSQFGEQYKDYAGNQDLVETAATRAVANAKAQGMDPNKYMFSATPTFFKDVVKIMDGWGIVKKADEDDDKPVTQRTSGIPGGLESGGALSKGQDPDDLRMPTLMDELRPWKEKTGFYA